MCGKFVIKSGEKQEQHPLEAVINQKVQGINEGRQKPAGGRKTEAEDQRSNRSEREYVLCYYFIHYL